MELLIVLPAPLQFRNRVNDVTTNSSVAGSRYLSLSRLVNIFNCRLMISVICRGEPDQIHYLQTRQITFLKCLMFFVSKSIPLPQLLVESFFCFKEKEVIYIYIIIHIFL